MVSSAPAPGFIHYESGFCSGPAPDFIHFSVSVRVRNLSSKPCPCPDLIHFESGSGFYKACPGPRPDSTNTPFSVHLEKQSRNLFRNNAMHHAFYG